MYKLYCPAFPIELTSKLQKLLELVERTMSANQLLTSPALPVPFSVFTEPNKAQNQNKLQQDLEVFEILDSVNILNI